jgi:diguanylate cyclase (GGDEF)-like protein
MVAQAELSQIQLGLTQLDLIGERTGEERKRMLDALTGVWNRAGTLEVLEASSARSHAADQPLSIIYVKVSDRAGTRSSWSDQGGDIILSEAAQALRSCVLAHDAIGRISDNEFLIVLNTTDAVQAAKRIPTLQKHATENPILNSLQASLSFEACTSLPGDPRSPEQLIESVSSKARCSAGARD